MSSVNKVILIGRLGQDPEVRTFQSGGKVCNLSVATSIKYKDRNTGERKEITEWNRVSVWVDPTIRFLEQYARKGDLLYIEGSLSTRKWQDQSGQDRYTTEIEVRPYRGEVKILASKDAPDRERESHGASEGSDYQPSDHSPIDDSEIPF